MGSAVIFFIVMGGIYQGFFTPTEAGAAGAFLAIIYALITRRMTRRGFMAALIRTIRTTSFIFMLVIAGQIFGFFLSASRIPIELGEWIKGLDVAPAIIVTAIFVIYFILGALMDEIAILVIMTPIMYPVIMGVQDFEPHYEGSSIVFGPESGVTSARGSHELTARAGHHLPPLTEGRDLFEELGSGFTLLALDTDAQTVADFQAAAGSMGIPLAVVALGQAGEGYGSQLVLVRPDHYVAWNGGPESAEAVLGRAVGA